MVRDYNCYYFNINYQILNMIKNSYIFLSLLFLLFANNKLEPNSSVFLRKVEITDSILLDAISKMYKENEYAYKNFHSLRIEKSDIGNAFYISVDEYWPMKHPPFKYYLNVGGRIVFLTDDIPIGPFRITNKISLFSLCYTDYTLPSVGAAHYQWFIYYPNKKIQILIDGKYGQ